MAERPLPAYDGDEPYIFVSYSHADDEFVYPEIRWLQDHGFNVWYDEGISGASRWRDAIAGRLGGCHLLLFYVSPNSVESRVCREELEYVLDLDRPVLSVYLAPTVLPEGIKLAISTRQALHREETDPEDYERKLVSAVATYLDQPLSEVPLLKAPRRSSRRSSWILLVAGLVVGGVAALLLTRWMVPEPGVPRAMARFTLDLPEGIGVFLQATSALAISKDGQQIVFSGTTANGSRALYVRRMSNLDARPISGAEERAASSVYLSPDGETVVFWDGLAGELRRIRITGGRPVKFGPLTEFGTTGMSWRPDGSVVYAYFGLFGPAPLMLAEEGAGSKRALTNPGPNEQHAHPHVLADGNTVLFSIGQADSGNIDDSQIAAFSLTTGEQSVITQGSNPRVTSSGHLLYLLDGVIWAVPFDQERLEITGTAKPVLEDIAITGMMTPALSVADDGSMVYLPKAAENGHELVWVDLDGNEERLPLPADFYFLPKISPDGSAATVLRGETAGSSGARLWTLSLTDRLDFTKLTEDHWPLHPMWNRDGKQIVYSKPGEAGVELHWRNIDGTVSDERSAAIIGPGPMTSWSIDENVAVYHECKVGGVSDCDIGQLDLTGMLDPELFLATEFSERGAKLSPDRRWMAYESDQSGQYEIYVRPFPEVNAGRWKISSDGGLHSMWSPDGKTLYYSGGSGMNRTMMAVDFTTEPTVQVGLPRNLFEFTQVFMVEFPSFDLHPDGTRFLIAKPSESITRPIYVQNWLSEVERMVPTE